MFNSGIYAYVGSAQNNLEKRIARHLKKDKKKFWHIDYLLKNKNVEIIDILYKVAYKNEECEMAKKINSISLPVKNFGSSDCKCESHLFKLNNYEDFKRLIKENMFLNFSYNTSTSLREIRKEKVKK